MNQRTKTEVERATEPAAQNLQRIILCKVPYGKTCSSVFRYFSGNSPINAIHCMNPTASPNILRHLSHLNSPYWQNICWFLPALNNQPTISTTWQRKLGQTFKFDSLLEKDRGNQLRYRQISSPPPLLSFRSIMPCCTLWQQPCLVIWHQKARLKGYCK